MCVVVSVASSIRVQGGADSVTKDRGGFSGHCWSSRELELEDKLIRTVRQGVWGSTQRKELVQKSWGRRKSRGAER